MIYLTYGDPPSGVFSSQVSDVVRHLDTGFGIRVRLVAFVSVRGFAESRRRIRAEVPGAWVLPIVPRLNRWKPSAAVFRFVMHRLGEQAVLARGVLACSIALRARRAGSGVMIGYDGRGAIAAEWQEYAVARYRNIRRTIRHLESEAVLRSDHRIAVSNGLVRYWEDSFGYHGTAHTVIPCTLNTSIGFELPADEALQRQRRELGYSPDDVVVAYSGSVSGWQSFRLVSEIMTPLLQSRPGVKLLFLSGDDPHIDALKASFPGQVTQRWVPHGDVHDVLLACDHALLLRESTTTNRVAAPTKFAEYLAAGLPVFISEGIGDYTDFVRSHRCGQVAGDGAFNPERTPRDRREHCIGLARTFFTKEALRDAYRAVIGALVPGSG